MNLNFSTETNHLLACLSPSTLDELAPAMREIVLQRGAVLEDAGEEGIYFPRSGMVSLVVPVSGGEPVETATIGREGMIGSLAAQSLPQPPRFQALVQLPGRAIRIAAARLQQAAERDARLMQVLLAHDSSLLAQTQQSVVCQARHDVESRLCRWLLHARDRAESDALPLTQEFMAQMLGVRRTTVTLVARKLQAGGMIRYRRGHIEVCDADALEQAACECYRIVRGRIEALPGAPGVIPESDADGHISPLPLAETAAVQPASNRPGA